MTSNPPRIDPVEQRSDTMRRLQIGVSGVLAVLLLVGLAGLIGDRAREEAGVKAKADGTVTMPGEAKATGSGPLVELGVQASGPPEPTENEIEEPVLPPRVTVPDLEPDPELQRARKSDQ